MAPPSVTTAGRPVSVFWLAACAAWTCGIVIAVLGMLSAVSSWNRTDMSFACFLCLFAGLILGSLA
jgi:hypothetical protein